MNLDATFTIPHSVLSRLVGDETVILELESGGYFGLDPVGAHIWELMGKGKSFGELCEIMVKEYEVEHDRLERDIEALVAELTKRRLIMVKDG
jgi:hypothetical protein